MAPERPDDLETAHVALAEARAFAARERSRRGGLAALGAGLALVLLVAASLLNLGPLALVPVLALGPAQAALVRWVRFEPDARLLPPWTHTAVALGSIGIILGAGVALERTDLVAPAAIAAVGALALLQGARARDPLVGALGSAALLVGACAPFVPPGGHLALTGGALLVAAGFAGVAFVRVNDARTRDAPA